VIPPVIERWLIAQALESGRPLPDWLRRRVECSPELRRYAASLGKIESALGDPAGAPTLAPRAGLSLRIAEALANPVVPARRSLPLGWVGGALVAGAVLVVLVVALRVGPGTNEPARPQASKMPTIPQQFRGPIMTMVGPMERPLDDRWQAIAGQTRRSVSGFIRGLPGLPVGDPNQSRLN
jgi:hypothetical protein